MNLDRIKKFIAGSGVLIIAYLAFTLIYLLSLQYVPATLSIEMKAYGSDMGQVFYNTGTGYRETESIWFDIDDIGSFKSYYFQLPGAKFSSLRIDPLTREGKFAVKSIGVESMNYSLKLEGEVLKDALVPFNQVELFFQDGVVHGISTGIDPQFGLDGAWIVNHLPFYVSLLLILVLLLLLLGANKLFPGRQYEISFILFLVMFALPSVLPRLFSIALAVIAVALFGYLLFRNKNLHSATPPNNSNIGLTVRAGFINKKFVYATCLISVVLLAFLLRYINLTILDPYTDEYSHLLAAINYLDTGAFGYPRARFVTYMVSLFYRIGDPSTFYEYLFWGRLPGVIFSSLTVIPLYFLTHKISFPVALISCFLWATSPWAIGVARTIREYAFYPFFILLAALLLVKFFELLLVFRMRHLPKILLCLLPVIALVVYAFRFDEASTLRACVLVLAGIVAYYLMININRLRQLAKTNRAIFMLIIFLLCLVAVLALLYANKTPQVSLENLRLSDYWLRIFIVPGNPGAPMHWWGDNCFLAVAAFILGIGFLYAVFNTKKYRHYFVHLAVFSVIIFFFVFFFDRYYRPRYIFYALPFFVPLLAVSLYALIDFAKKLKPIPLKITGYLAVALFLFQGFNYQNMIYPVISKEHGYVKTTDEHHDSLRSTIALLEQEIEPGDYFITTIARSMLMLSFNIEKERISSYNYKKADRFERVERIIEENPQGFMILDWRRNGYFADGYPKEGQFMIGETAVEVIQNKDGMQVYRWKR